MVKKLGAPLVSIGLAFSAFPAQAVTVAGDPADYLVPSGTLFDGVVEIRFSRQSASGQELGCSGSLLETGQHVLTAAHCFTNKSGVLDVEKSSSSIFFDLPSGRQGISPKRFFIHPDWTPSTDAGIGINDVAIIKLAAEAPAEANRYDIYRSNDEIGQDGFKFGYGESGNGNEGAVLGGGEKRFGLNRYDALGDELLRVQDPTSGRSTFAGTILTGTQLAYDFDNGNSANDGLSPFGLADLGLELEGFPARGDSGGPTFLDSSQIAGIVSFSSRVILTDGTTETSSDIDNTLNSSFGELGVDTRVSAYANWIDGTLAAKPVPEPSSVLGTLAFGVLGAGALLRQKRKQQ